MILVSKAHAQAELHLLEIVGMVLGRSVGHALNGAVADGVSNEPCDCIRRMTLGSEAF
jgi:hypothetical protein